MVPEHTPFTALGHGQARDLCPVFGDRRDQVFGQGSMGAEKQEEG
jgi:hypothetical protein